jgi:hypothetical protein
MSEGIATLGTTLTLNAVPIAQIQDIEGPDLSTDTDEITNHSSPDATEEFLVTIKRVGEITFPLVFNSALASHDAFFAAWEDRSLDTYVMTYPDSSAWEFEAYVTGFSMSAPVDGHLSADVTLRMGSAPTFTGVGS